MSSGPGNVALDQRLAKVVARPLAKTGLHPNAVTAFSVLVGLCAGWLFMQSSEAANWGALVFVLAAWLDHVDGELARQTNRTSEFGHHFDHAAAMTNYVVMFVGAGIGLSNGQFGGWAIVLGVLAGVSVAAIMSFRMLVEIRAGRETVKQTVKFGFEMEDTLYLVAPITWLGLLEEFIGLAGIGAPTFLIFVIWDGIRRIRRSKEATAE